MQQKIPLNCWSFEIKELQEDDCRILQYEAEFEDQYLLLDVSIKGDHLRQVKKVISPTIYHVKYVEGNTLKKFISKHELIAEQNIELILAQIVEALCTLYKNKVMGRCFSTENIIWDGANATLMNFGYYPSVWQQYSSYNHKLDVLLLGRIACSLITSNTDENIDDAEEIIQNSPVKYSLKEVTLKMLRVQSQRIGMNEVAEYFVGNLTEDCINYFRKSYQVDCQIFDQTIQLREQYTSNIIQFRDDEQVEQRVFEPIEGLLYCNNSKEEDLDVWDKLHDRLYQISILAQLEEIAKYEFDPLEELFRSQALFIMAKTTLIMQCNFQAYINRSLQIENPFFAKNSKSLDCLKKILHSLIPFNKLIFGTQHELENIKYNVKPEFLKHFSTEIWEQSFDDIRFAFRFYTTKLYKQLIDRVQKSESREEEKDYLQKQFTVILAMIVQHVMDKKELHFKTLKGVVKCKIVFPNDIKERFINSASPQQLREQISEIYNIYFAK